MSKFKVGDIIKANKKSNEEYIVTTQKNGWTGIVLEVKSKGLIRVKTITPEFDNYTKFNVEEDYFDLV